MAAGVRAVRPQAPPLGEVEHLAQHRKHAIRLIGRLAVRMMQLRHVGAGDVGHLPLAKRRHDDPVEQPLVLRRGAALALRLGMLGKEPLAEFGLAAGHLVGGRVAAALDHAEQGFCLFARRLGRPRRAVPADRQLAQRRAAPGADAVMQHVALAAAALHAYAKALQLAIPQHRFGAIGRRLQRVYRALGDLAAHHPGSLSSDQWNGQVGGNDRQQSSALYD